MKTLHWLNALIGVWFIVAPWALGFSHDSGALWASIVVGVIQAIAAIWVAASEDVTGWGVWQTWITLLTGVWFILQPYLLSLGSKEEWSSTILGIITVIFSLWAMGVGKKTK